MKHINYIYNFNEKKIKYPKKKEYWIIIQKIRKKNFTFEDLLDLLNNNSNKYDDNEKIKLKENKKPNITNKCNNSNKAYVSNKSNKTIKKWS